MLFKLGHKGNQEFAIQNVDAYNKVINPYTNYTLRTIFHFQPQTTIQDKDKDQNAKSVPTKGMTAAWNLHSFNIT